MENESGPLRENLVNPNRGMQVGVCMNQIKLPTILEKPILVILSDFWSSLLFSAFNFDSILYFFVGFTTNYIQFQETEMWGEGSENSDQLHRARKTRDD